MRTKREKAGTRKQSPANTQPETPPAPKTTVCGPNTTPGAPQRAGYAYNHRCHIRHPARAPTNTSPHTPRRVTEPPGAPSCGRIERTAPHMPPSSPHSQREPRAHNRRHAPPRFSTRLHTETPGYASLQNAHSTRQTEQSAGMQKPGIAGTRIRSCVRWDQLHGNPKMARMARLDRPRAPTNLI